MTTPTNYVLARMNEWLYRRVEAHFTPELEGRAFTLALNTLCDLDARVANIPQAQHAMHQITRAHWLQGAQDYYTTIRDMAVKTSDWTPEDFLPHGISTETFVQDIAPYILANDVALGFPRRIQRLMDGRAPDDLSPAMMDNAWRRHYGLAGRWAEETTDLLVFGTRAVIRINAREDRNAREQHVMYEQTAKIVTAIAAPHTLIAQALFGDLERA